MIGIPVNLATLLISSMDSRLRAKISATSQLMIFCLPLGILLLGGGFKYEKLKYYSGEILTEFVLQPGDLLVTMTDLSKQSDTLGYPVFVPDTPGKRYLHNQRLGLVQIRSDAPLERLYLYYLMCSREYRYEIIASATGTTVKHTAPNRIKAFTFLLPGQKEQRAIAPSLSAGLEDDLLPGGHDPSKHKAKKKKAKAKKKKRKQAKAAKRKNRR